MTQDLQQDLEQLESRAFERADWARPVLRRYRALVRKLDPEFILHVQGLHQWMFVPPTLWPFNIQDVLDSCLAALETGKRLNPKHQLLIEILPEPPNETVCAAVAGHERSVQAGNYETLLRNPAKYAQNELAIHNHPQLRQQWRRIKAAFNVAAYRDYKGVIRRTMAVERNLRPSFNVNLRRQAEVFQAAFDAFCLRWNLYGMQRDNPLPLKLAVNITPYGTMIHIPAYWSFDPKRDIRWNAIAKLHGTRVPGRQGSALAEGLAERMRAARKLPKLDKETLRLKLKGEQKHEFLCAGLGLDGRTSAKRLSRLRTEFKAKRG